LAQAHATRLAALKARKSGSKNVTLADCSESSQTDFSISHFEGATV
jgi:hypothetical protein